MSAASSGALGVANVAGKSVVVSAFATSPLGLFTPKNHGHAAWAYMTTLGGGLVGGDDVGLSVRVGPQAAALLASQAQTKVYRAKAGGAACVQRLDVDVESGAVFACVPEPVACFRGARYEQTTRVRLAAADASAVVLDALSCGRAAAGERWAFARYLSRNVIERGGEVILDDVVELDARLGGDVAARMGAFGALATIVAAGPATRALRDDWARDAAERHGFGEDVRVACCARDADDVSVLRVAAVRVERLMQTVRRALRNLPDILGDDPFLRRP